MIYNNIIIYFSKIKKSLRIRRANVRITYTIGMHNIVRTYMGIIYVCDRCSGTFRRENRLDAAEE